jgi:hypothetical protein
MKSEAIRYGDSKMIEVVPKLALHKLEGGQPSP